MRHVSFILILDLKKLEKKRRKVVNSWPYCLPKISAQSNVFSVINDPDKDLVIVHRSFFDGET